MVYWSKEVNVVKRVICLLAVLVLLLSGCGVDLRTSTDMPDPDVVLYRDLRYFACEMDEESYMNMCAYYESAMAFEDWCELPYPAKQEEVEELIAVLRYECPELMMLDTTRGFELYTMGGDVTRVEVPYAMTESEYNSKLRQTRNVIEGIAGQCKELTDKQKEKLIYDYIVANCVYDENAQWAGTAYGCLVEGKAKCDGISSAMKWVSEEVGISCMTISGEPNDGSIGHAWNVICIDGQWYDLDVTADVNPEPGVAPCYPAYNVSDSWIRDRYILEEAYLNWGDLPGAEDMTGSYHSLSGSYIQAGEDDGMEELYMAAYEEAGTFILQFENTEDFEAFERELEERLEKLGNREKLSSWSWYMLSVPDYRTVSITAGA